jgi:hypothetical protein
MWDNLFWGLVEILTAVVVIDWARRWAEARERSAKDPLNYPSYQAVTSAVFWLGLMFGLAHGLLGGWWLWDVFLWAHEGGSP